MDKNNLGNLAYYDTLFNGLVPCKVTGLDGVNVYFTVTADRGTYKRGEKLSSTGFHVVPRKMVYVRNGQYRINPSYQWVNGATVYAIITRR